MRSSPSRLSRDDNSGSSKSSTLWKKKKHPIISVRGDRHKNCSRDARFQEHNSPQMIIIRGQLLWAREHMPHRNCNIKRIWTLLLLGKQLIHICIMLWLQRSRQKHITEREMRWGYFLWCIRRNHSKTRPSSLRATVVRRIYRYLLSYRPDPLGREMLASLPAWGREASAREGEVREGAEWKRWGWRVIATPWRRWIRVCYIGRSLYSRRELGWNGPSEPDWGDMVSQP